MESLLAAAKLPLLLFTLFANGLLATVVIRDNPRGATNRAFFLLGTITTIWLLFLSASEYPQFFGHNLLFARLTLCAAVFQSLAFYIFARVMPSVTFPKFCWRLISAIVAACIVAVLTLTPLVFREISVEANGISHYQVGPGMFAFVILTIIFSVACVVTLWKKMHGSGEGERRPFRLVLMGIFLMLGLIITTIMLPIALFGYDKLLSFAPFYVTIFLSITAYAIVRYSLFNVKLIATEAFVIILSILFLARISSGQEPSQRLVDTVIFFSTASFGILLIRSVKQEVASREKIQKLANTLSETNWELAKKNEQLRIIDQRKSEFVSIVSHQLRTPITAIKGYTSLALEGSYGELPVALKETLEKVFISSGRLADMVSDFLDISKIEQGTMLFTFKQIDFGAMVKEVVNDLHPRAEEKKLRLDVVIPQGMSFAAIADDGKLRQILSNVIDNSIKYTPSGGITITVEKNEEKKRLTCRIKDTGIGLSQDDLHHLFGKFTRGSEGSKINTAGSGLGLFVARRMLEAHKGTIWVDSEGPGKGSTFVIELLSEGNPNSPAIGTWSAKQEEEGRGTGEASPAVTPALPK